MDVYFAAAFLPDTPDRTTVVTLHNSIELPADPSDPNSKKIPVQVLGLAVGDTSGYTRLRLFAGPKATDLLSSIHAIGQDGKPDGPSLSSLIQFGTWLGLSPSRFTWSCALWSGSGFRTGAGPSSSSP